MRVLLGLGLMAGLAAGCSKAPSADQCKNALDHLLELEIEDAGGTTGLTPEMKTDLDKQKASVSEQLRTNFMDACVKKTPKDIVQCTLNAKTLGEAGKCDES